GQQGQQGQQAQQGQQGQQNATNRQLTQNQQRDATRQGAQNGGPGGGGERTQNFGPRRFFDGNPTGEEGEAERRGPLTGQDYSQWSDRLRDVEELIDVPELRDEVARVRDRARTMRQDFKRHSKAPQWPIVKAEIAGPLNEVRNRVTEELARREKSDALVPI